MKKLKQGSKSGWEDTFHLVVTGVSKEVLFKIKIWKSGVNHAKIHAKIQGQSIPGSENNLDMFLV